MSLELYQSVRKYVKNSGKKQNEIATATGIEQASISRFMKGKQSLSSDNFLALIDFLGLQLTMPNENAVIHGIGTNSPIKSIADAQETKTINVYDMAGAGPGISVNDMEPICTVSAPPEYLRLSDFALKILGHSMEPLIPNGAVVGVKRDVPFQANELYAAYIPYEGLVVKRIGVDRMTNEYIFKSTNPDKEAYPDFRISITECEKIIVGRVVWVMVGY